MSSVFDLSADNLSGSPVNLSEYRGKVLLIVNTASKCGLTPQYKGLEALYEKFREEGLEILGFPCNQFAGQEPGSAEAISEFCQMNYGVSFPMFAKVDVNGENTHPVFKLLKEAAPGLMGSKQIKWNFTKFLVGRDGSVIRRYAPATTPDKIEDDIKVALASSG